MFLRRSIAVVFFAQLIGLPVRASQPPSGVEVHAAFSHRQALPGTVVDFCVTISFPEHWLVFDTHQQTDAVLPTTIKIQRSDAFAPLENFRSPRALERPDPIFNRVVRYFSESPTFRRPVLISPGLQPGMFELKATVDFQLYDESAGQYYVVRHLPVSAVIEITDTEIAEPGTLQLPEEPNPHPVEQSTDTPTIIETVAVPSQQDPVTEPVPVAEPAPISESAPAADSNLPTDDEPAVELTSSVAPEPAGKLLTTDKVIPLAVIEVDQDRSGGSDTSGFQKLLLVAAAGAAGFVLGQLPKWIARKR